MSFTIARRLSTAPITITPSCCRFAALTPTCASHAAIFARRLAASYSWSTNDSSERSVSDPLGFHVALHVRANAVISGRRRANASGASSNRAMNALKSNLPSGRWIRTLLSRIFAGIEWLAFHEANAPPMSSEVNSCLIRFRWAPGAISEEMLTHLTHHQIPMLKESVP